MLEVLAAAGIVSLALLGSGYALQSVAKTQKKAAALLAIENVRNNIQQAIKDDNAWKNTLTNPANEGMFDCTIEGTPCIESEQPLSFSLFDSVNKAIATPSNTSGFNISSEVCNQFGTSDDCKWRFDLTWKPVCPPAGPCTTSLVEVIAKLQRSEMDTKDFVINTNRYQVRVMRSASTSEIADLCAMMGGSLETASNLCLFETPDEISCDAYTNPGVGRRILVGLDSAGNAICRNLFELGAVPCASFARGFTGTAVLNCIAPAVAGRTCPGGQFVRQVTNEGNIACAPPF